MRAAGLALLVATGGCNAIFGLKDNLSERDASPYEGGADAAWGTMHLTYQVMETPTGPIDYLPIPGATVEIGPIDPTDRSLHSLPLAPDGSFLVPPTPPDTPYRLVYTVDSLPTELQSTLNTGHFVVPMVGRIDRSSTPSHAQISFAPLSAPAGTIQVRVMTVGLWTVSAFTPGNDLVSLPYTYDYQATAASQNGPQGSLDMAHGDVEVIAQISNGDVTGYAVASVLQLNPNPPGPAAVAQGTWRTPPLTKLYYLDPAGGTYDPKARMTSVLAPYVDADSKQARWGGVIPSSAMPNLLEPTPGDLDGEQFAALSKSVGTNPLSFMNPFAGTDSLTLPTAIYSRDTNSRALTPTLTLTSGFQGIALQTDSAAAVDLHYKVGIAHHGSQDPTLTAEGITPVSAVTLTMTDDQVLELKGAKLVDLTFDTDYAVDDCVTTVYRVETASLTPVRRLLTQKPPATAPFRLDASVFSPNKTYILGIVCRLGLPGANVGDYTQVSYPFQTSTIYTRTFSVMP